MLDVVVSGHCVCRGGDTRFAEVCLWLVLKRDDVRHACRQLVRPANLGDTTDIVKLGLVVEVVEVTAFQCHAVAVIEVARLAAVAPGVVDALYIHVHLRLVAVLVPHTLSRAVGRKGLLDDVAVTVILVVGDCRAAAELLRHLCQMVRVLGVVSRRHVVIRRSVTSDNGHVRRKSEDVPVGIGGVPDVCRKVIAARTAAAEAALVAVAVGLQLSVIAVEIILVPCLGDYHALRCALVLPVGGVAERDEGGGAVAAEHGLLGESVLVTVGSEVVAVVLVTGLGVLVAFGIFHGSTELVALCVVGGDIIKPDCLTIDCRITFLGVDIFCNDLSEAKELALVAVLPSVGVVEHRLHQRTIVMDTVVDGHGRHHPLAAGQTVGRRAVLIIECKGTAEGVGDALEHVRPADGRAGHLQLAFLVGFHDVEVAVAIYVLQSVGRAIDAVAGRGTGINGYFHKELYCRRECRIHGFGCGRGI